MLTIEGSLSNQQEAFEKLSRLLSSIYHFEFHQTIEKLSDAYAPINPDSDTRTPDLIDHPVDDSFIELMESTLEKANYNRISEADLNLAMTESSLFKVRLQVDFNDFSDAFLFCRGESVREEIIKKWFGLYEKNITFINYDRVVIYIRFKDDYIQKSSSPPYCKSGSTLLKLFQNVPKADLEMLFPNTAVRMRTIDKLLIGIPAVVSGGIVLTTKLGASLVLLGSLLGFWLGISNEVVELNKTALLALLAGFATLTGYLWKQFSSFNNRKMRFIQTLTQNLYFKNLDNNAGVLHRLVNDAEKEEFKEAILAYYFLLISKQALSEAELDQTIESWFSSKWDCSVNFEIDDALGKLSSLELVECQNDKYKAIPLDAAISKLDRRWDDYFVTDKKT